MFRFRLQMRLFIRKECSDPANCALPGPAIVTEKNELIVVHGKDEGGDIFYYPHPEDDLLILGINLCLMLLNVQLR